MLRSGEARQVHVTPLDRAYLDASSLLDQTGQCRDFFGGDAVQGALEHFVAQLQEKRIGDVHIGIRMWGAFTSFADANETFSFRLFANAELNIAGPFCRAKTFAADPFVPSVGSFQPNTREVRVLILLHELAHLIAGPDGKWLIADDGGNPQLSSLNTSIVEARCGRQIRAL
jgi:hypothetical protein